MELAQTILTSAAVVALINGIFALIQSSKSKKSGLEKGVQFLLLDSLKRQGHQYLADGKIDAEDLKAYDEMYQCYHVALKGNGFADAVYSKVKALPIKND